MKYALLPGIVPRVWDFFSSGFIHLSALIAGVFGAVRLLPPQHPYLNPANAGRFGIRNVLAEARKNLVFSRENLDQVIIYYTLLLGLFLLLLQFVLALLAISVKGALAGSVGPYFAQFFVTEFPADDVAFVMLDRVFGFQGLFNSRVNGEAGWPSPFHEGLHLFFNFYNVGICAVGLVIFLYLVVTTVAETAQTGIPFGRRFNKVWAPVRMMLAVALLAPLLWGMNGAQLITLRVAKWGSSLATNGWIVFNTIMLDAGSTPLGMPDTIVVNPNPPGFNAMLEFAFVARTCMYAEAWVNGRVEDPVTMEPSVKAYQVYEQQYWELPGSFTEALANSQNGDIVIRFGELSEEYYLKTRGFVKPTCGEVVIQPKDLDSDGAYAMQEGYYNIISELWTDGPTDILAQNIVKRILPVTQKDPMAPTPDSDYVQDTKQWFDQLILDTIQNARTAAAADDKWLEDVTRLGWGGAGTWYNKVAELNGSLISSAFNLPSPTLYPDVMEYVRDQRKAANNFIFGPERYSPKLANNKTVEFRTPSEAYIAEALYYAQSFWQDQFVGQQGNPFTDTITALFGLEGLINLYTNTDTHPLAQLVGVGRSLVESAITNLGYSFGTGILGGLMNIAGMTDIAKVGMGAASFMVQVALIALAMGFILGYVVPFLPFVYFFFAVCAWVKAVFEAMVGLPLWALAHIRIDGEGIPGSAGMNGYYLIFEIFTRPILTIFGLVASITILAAQVRVMHTIWYLVISNLTGHDSTPLDPNFAVVAPIANETGSIEFFRDKIDEFFYMIIYAITVYMMAMASFKLIDQIPSNILRWMGATVPTFESRIQDPAGQLIGNTFVGAQSVVGGIGQAGGGLQALAMRGSK